MPRRAGLLASLMSAAEPFDDPHLVVYDLDGVVTRKDTFTAFVVERLRRAPLLLLRALPAVGAMLLRSGEGRRRSARRVAEIALTGLDERGHSALAADFARRIVAKPSWVRAETVHRMRRQHAAGAQIVVATACEQHLARALLAHAGAPCDLLCASLLAESASGMRVADHRVGARKTQALRELGVPVEEAEFVTDSVADLPTALVAARVVLVGASARTRARYARAGVTAAVEAP